jgi:hypothetical protein
MGNEMNYFDVFPRSVRAGRDEIVTVRPLFGHVQFFLDKPCTVTLIPVGGNAGQVVWGRQQVQSIMPADGELRVPCQFELEQEYRLQVEQDGRPPAEFRLYALEADLFDRRPYKGDFHMHTHYSDGRESPAYVAASCRRIGMDFMAVTDHHRYAPSLEAAAAFDNVALDLRIFPGEEVHPPNNPVHMLNFGGNFSVNELFKSETYQAEVEAIANQLKDFPDGVDRYPYASCEWCFQKIREAGGLGVFCHPYWINRARYDVPQTLTNLLLERQPYDALELIGGYHRFEVESNALQVARYHEERAGGKRIPIVGVSDSHGCETGSLFGWYYTIAFSPSLKLSDLICSIKDLYSVAVEALPGETPRAFGPFRLVQYAHYLMREIFPAHDRLCAQEGSLMLAHASGDADSAEALARMKSQTQSLYQHWWGQYK